MPGPRYTPEQIDRAAEMREAGQDCATIAAETGMTQAAVWWHCARLGAEPPGARYRERAPGPMVMKRGNHIVRRFTPEEDRRMLDMRRRGLRVYQIADELGRQQNSVSNRLMALARREALQEEDA
jgi:transcriptional regulator